MSFTWTEEQEHLFSTIKNTDKTYILVDAVAGASKSSSVIESFRRMPTKRGVYFAYNKAIADEFEEEAPGNLKSSTLHSFAYRYTVKANNLKVDNFTYKSLPNNMHFDDKRLIIETLKNYCLGRCVSFDSFYEESYKEATMVFDIEELKYKQVVERAKGYFLSMIMGEMPISHDAYLKKFHIMLVQGLVHLDPVDYLVIDECGDLFGCSIEIVKNYPARRKILLGDERQNVNQYLNTVSAFDEFRDYQDAVFCELKQSFRCQPQIAEPVQAFMRKFPGNEDFKFKGTHSDKKEINKIMYLSRTNSGLIEKIIEFAEAGKKFNLIRKIQDIFGLVLSVARLNTNDDVFFTSAKFLERDKQKYNRIIQNKETKQSFLVWLGDEYPTDVSIQSAIKLIRTIGIPDLFFAYKYAKEISMKKYKDAPSFSTAHGSKGLTVDRVIILDDLNKSVEKVVIALEDGADYTDEMDAEIMLYYVAVTRARVSVVNATQLETNATLAQL